MANITKPSGLSNIWAAAGTKIDPGNAKVGLGWVVQLPPYEYQNWVDNRQDAAIAHINQHGVAEWDAVTEYQGNLSYTQGSNGMIYKCLVTHTNKDPINTLNSTFWVLAFENFGSVQVVSDALANHVTNYQTLANIGNVSAARANLSVYSRAESDSRFAGLNGSSGQVFSVAPATAPEHAVRLGQVSSLLTQATESTLGVVRLASNGLTEAGIDDLTAITPLKANTVYLKKSGNLAGLGNIATARANLGLGTSATQPSTAFLNTSNNLSDILNQATARANLGLTSIVTQPETNFLRTAQNLADLSNISTARNNLGLQSTATTPLSSLMLKADNLAGLASPATARANLGLGSAATQPDTAFLKPGENLFELTNKQQARNNLGLGNSATHNFITSVGNPGYLVMPDGIVFQWGTTDVPSPGLILNLPQPLTEVYSLTATAHATTSAADGIEVRIVSPTQIQLVCYAGVSQNAGRASWWVVGKI